MFGLFRRKEDRTDHGAIAQFKEVMREKDSWREYAKIMEDNSANLKTELEKWTRQASEYAAEVKSQAAVIRNLPQTNDDLRKTLYDAVQSKEAVEKSADTYNAGPVDTSMHFS